VQTIASEHEEDLNSLLHGRRREWPSRGLKRSRYMAWPIGPREEVSLPADHFWLCRTPSATVPERLSTSQAQLALRQEDLCIALREMRRFSEGAPGRIIGFHSATPVPVVPGL